MAINLSLLSKPVVIGSKEEQANAVAVRAREGDVRYCVKLDDFVSEVSEKVRTYA